MRSYTSETKDGIAFLNEVLTLYRRYKRDIGKRVSAAIEDAQHVERLIFDRLGVRIEKMEILEIGPGQFLSQMNYFAIRNSIVGIDRDLIFFGFKPGECIKMFRTNGVQRSVKTIARKLIGIDRKYISELKKQLNISILPRLRVIQMDVRELKFKDNSFDFVYVRSVLHHLPDPGVALDGIARVLKPGGVAYISIHLYTSPTGSLDPRLFSINGNEMGLWPHLRPRLIDNVRRANAFLNKMRLVEWYNLFSDKMPGVDCILTRANDSTYESAARALQRQGEMLEYSLDELLTFEVVAIWKKQS